MGSSNFTASGLGLYESANLELNLLCKNSDDISDCTDFFERLKSEKCEDATNEVIANIDTAAFYRAPSEIILKIYQDYNKDFENVKEPEKISKAGELFRLFDFQKQAASELYKRLESYGVAMLADPVGAGKTLSALAISSGYKRVAIIVPKRLKVQWESYFVGANLNEFEREFLQNLIGKTLILSYHEAQNPSDLQRQFLGFAELIIIDESHNFRNGGNFKSTLQSSKNSEKSQNRYDKMRQNLNPEAKLLLLSATPINNYYEDLAHQIGLLQNKILMGGEYIDISQACKKATRLSKKGELLNKDYMTLTHSIVARSAEKIAEFLKDLGKDMPKPNIAQFALSSVPSEFEFDFDALCKILGLNDESAAKMSSKKAFDKPSDWAFERASKRQKDIIKFCIYDPFDYLPKNIQEALQDKRLANLQGYDTPVGFICMKLIKALESSVEAFLGILSTIKSYYENALKIHEKNGTSGDFADIEASELDEIDEMALPIRFKDVLEKGYFHALNDEFFEDLRSDLNKFNEIQSLFANYEKPANKGTAELLKASEFKQTSIFKAPKFTKLCEIIKEISQISQKSVNSLDKNGAQSALNSSENKAQSTLNLNENTTPKSVNSAFKKLIIFTESQVSAKSLFINLSAAFKGLKFGLICGDLSDKDFHAQKRLFSPHSQGYTLKANEREIDILIATDCLSEGANLQDCANLINYDIAFNPVRAIQRIGRVWRIGSKHEVIGVWHFLPNCDLESYIGLEAKLKYKIAAAQSATAISSPFKFEGIDENKSRFAQQRKKHYEQLKSDFIAVENEEFNSFLSVQNVLSQARGEILNAKNATQNATENSQISAQNSQNSTQSTNGANPLPEGIFSIALEPNLPQNLLLIALKDEQNAPQLVLYDIGAKSLKKGASEQADIASLLAVLKNHTQIVRAEFEKFEKFTDFYSDLREFKRIFKRAVNAFDTDFKRLERKRIKQNDSDSGFLPFESKFKLIAWLFINPNFTQMKG